jgi:hypothetical protein
MGGCIEFHSGGGERAQHAFTKYKRRVFVFVAFWWMDD